MNYLKVWVNFEDILAPLNDDEIGRLFLAMLRYARTGEEQESFEGNESFLWPVAKRDIDNMVERSETLRQNGSKGGIAKSRNKQALANDSKTYQDVATVSNANQDVATFSLKEKKRKEIEIKERKEEETSKEEAFIANDEAHVIQAEQNRVLDAAEDAGFLKSNSVRAGLLKLYTEHGLEKVLAGIESCVKHGACNLAYLDACMKDRPKKPTGKVLPAHDFEQRDYSGVQGELMRQLEKDMAEFKASNTG